MNEPTNIRTDERKRENYIPVGINAGGIKTGSPENIGKNRTNRSTGQPVNLKHGVQRSHSQACSLKKMHTTLYLFCFQMSCVVFWNKKKRVVRKKSLNTFSLAANIL